MSFFCINTVNGLKSSGDHLFPACEMFLIAYSGDAYLIKERKYITF